MRLDYIQEELARQQLALAALLRGQAVWEKRKAEVAPDLQSQTLIKRGQTSAVSDWERFLEERTIKEAEPVPIIQTGDAEKTVLRSEKGSLFHAAERGEGRRALPLRHQPESGGWAWGGLVPEAVNTVWEMEPETATRMAANVWAVSRAVQRDARRYDGGFTLY